MKKWIATLLVGMLALSMMTACNNSDKPTQAGGANVATENNAGDTDNKKKNDESSIPTVEELLTKVTEANTNLKSYSMEAEVKQKMLVRQGEERQEQVISTKMSSDIVNDPIEAYQTIEISMDSIDTQVVEQYITQNGIYMNQNGTWTKMPQSMFDEMMKMVEQSSDMSTQLDNFRKITDDAKVTAEGDEYIMSANLSGDGLKDVVKSFMNSAGSTTEDVSAIMDQMKLKDMTISYAINKETFIPNSFNLTMTMSLTDPESGLNVSLEQEMKSTLSKINEITKIDIPQEILNDVN